MGKIQLTRIDDRLVHGQVMTKWSKGLGINAIFIVDNEVAKDDFMKQIFISSGSRSGLMMKVFSIDELNHYYKETDFEDYKVLLLFKSISAVNDAIELGLPITVVNLGGISKKKDAKIVISTVYITDGEIELLKKMNLNQSIDISFQTLPDSNKVNFEDWIKKQ